jgi:hypothetical protein
MFSGQRCANVLARPPTSRINPNRVIRLGRFAVELGFERTIPGLKRAEPLADHFTFASMVYYLEHYTGEISSADQFKAALQGPHAQVIDEL